jgi:hypothetical protein
MHAISKEEAFGKLARGEGRFLGCGREMPIFYAPIRAIIGGSIATRACVPHRYGTKIDGLIVCQRTKIE